MTQQLSTNTFGCAKWIVSADPTQGTHTTISSAIASASSGDTIFIRPGTYTEDPTLKAGVNLTAYVCNSAAADGSSPSNLPTTIINGKLTASYTGIVAISGIMLQTNNDFLLVMSGSTTTDLEIFDCFIFALNHTAISMTTTVGKLNIYRTNGQLGTTGISYISQTSGTINLYYSTFLNEIGHSTTASTTTGVLTLIYTVFINPITVDTGGVLIAIYSQFFDAGNVTILTLGGAASVIERCSVASGSASAISISTSATVAGCRIASSNTNAITGSGTLIYGDLIFTGTSSLINTSTQTPLPFNPGSIVTGSNLTFLNAGNKIITPVATTTTAGANSFGSVTLVSGTATIATTAVTSSSLINVWRQSVGSSTALGNLTVGTITAGTSFVISAATQASPGTPLAADVSVVGWEVIN